MSASILNSVKKNLGLEAGYTAFDSDVIMHINSILATLNQLGVGPEEGFMIEDATPTWDDFFGANPRMNFCMTYVYLRVKMLFDPASTSYWVTAMNEQIREFEWRINTYRESYAWVNPYPVIVPEEDLVLDGGGP